jgi:peptide/nickel transport system permease protein
VLGATGWFATSRIVRGEVLRIREEAFVDAARALGAGSGRIIFRHLLPNTAGPLLVAATLGVGDVILLEAGLSFLGVGVRPPTPSWGGMIDGAPRHPAPRESLPASPSHHRTAVNLVGEALRAALYPRGTLRRSGSDLDQLPDGGHAGVRRGRGQPYPRTRGDACRCR